MMAEKKKPCTVAIETNNALIMVERAQRAFGNPTDQFVLFDVPAIIKSLKKKGGPK